MRTASSKLWGGRFRKPTDPRVECFTSSIHVDHRLVKYDVQGSIAHATMLGRCGIISKTEAAKLVKGLTQILRRIEQGRFVPDPAAEDIHTQIQHMLTKLVGPVADKLHTARSRNDQVALDLRLYSREAVVSLQQGLRRLQQALVGLAAKYVDVIIPGYTHLQRAQPVLAAHHLLAYVEMLQRDSDRLQDALKRINVLPLGSGALAGTSLPINRRQVARLLGFAAVSQNSMDAVSDRDVAVEVAAAIALASVHLSRLAEDLILWSTQEFGLLELDDAFATGSSLMPHKKNPDVLELVRGQAGLVIGKLVALLTMLKGLPLAYNRDLQWDKATLFGAVDHLYQALTVLEPLVRSMRINRRAAATLVQADMLCATDLAEYLVTKGVPFRQAHHLVGQVVLAAERKGCNLRDIPLIEWRRVSPMFGPWVATLLNARRSVARKTSEGGTSPAQVARALARWRRQLHAGRG